MDYKYICAVVDTNDRYEIHTPGDVAHVRGVEHGDPNGPYSQYPHFLIAIGGDGLSQVPKVADNEYPMDRFRRAVQGSIQDITARETNLTLASLLAQLAEDPKYVVLNHNVCSQVENPNMLLPE